MTAQFWSRLAEQFTKLGRRYPEMDAKKIEGQWEFPGAPQEAVDQYKNLAEVAAKACGFVGTRDQACQYWLNRVNTHQRTGK